MSSVLVDSVELVQKLIELIKTSQLPSTFIFIDLEGTNLSRHGSIAIMQILVPPAPIVHLVDIETLKEQAFETQTSGGHSLKSILESETIAKVFFHVRNDSDALYSHYNVNLRGVVDIQLLEFATRSSPGRFVKGLAKCISEDGGLGRTEQCAWQEAKDAGSKLFAPEKGGSYDVLHQRPLQAAIVQYCVQDVLILPELLTRYARRLSEHHASQIASETDSRVRLSQSLHFNGSGRHMAVGPAFTRRRTGTAHLLFPMSMVASPGLVACCTLDTISARDAEAEESEQQQQEDLFASLSSDNGYDDLIRQTRENLELFTSLQIGSRTDTRFSVIHEDEDDDNGDEEEELRWNDNNNSSSWYEGDSPRDFAACSAEDCGWCGKCDY